MPNLKGLLKMAICVISNGETSTGLILNDGDQLVIQSGDRMEKASLADGSMELMLPAIVWK